MAIAKLKKLQLVAHDTLRERLLEELQQIGGVHIIDWREEGELSGEQAPEPPSQPSSSQVQAVLQRIEYCFKFIKPFEPSLGLMQKLAQPRPRVTLEQLKELERRFDLDDVYRRCRQLEREYHELQQRRQALRAQVAELRPWCGLDVPLAELRQTRTTYIHALRLPQEQALHFQQLVRERLAEESLCHEINREGDYCYWVVVVLKEAKPLLESCLVESEAEQVELPVEHCSPRELIRDLVQRLYECQRQLGQVAGQSAELVRFKPELEKLFDYYHNRQTQEQVQNALFNTSRTLVLEGWVLAGQVDRLTRRLEGKFQEIAIHLRDPAEDEAVPVELTNRKLVTPFEGITKLYGLPHAGEVDPTPLLAPFFFVFFGLCLTDGGYGILLMLGSFWCLRKLLLGEGPRQMMRLFFLAGLATVLAGALTGGWFGDMIDLLPASFAPLQALKNKLMLFDPINDPLTFMLLSLILGYVQVCFGIAVELYDNFRHRQVKPALLVQLPWLMLLLGLGLYGLEVAGASSAFIPLRKLLVYAGAGALLLLSPYDERNPLKRVGKGLLELYNIVAYMSDILSYSRLLALGLATGVIGMVVNKIALLTTGVPFLGYFFMLLIMLGGHLFNLAINALGSFVHTSRLQFVEFFPKFFEGGGKPFRPFRWEEKYSNFYTEKEAV